MNRAFLLLMAALIAVSACGIRRPLMRPSEIPEYEEKRARRMEKFEQKAEPPAAPAEPGPSLLERQPGGQSLQDMMTPLPRVEEQR